MTGTGTARLLGCISRYGATLPDLAALGASLKTDPPASPVDAYTACYPILERALWTGATDFDPLLDCYQSLFREQEALLHRHLRETGSPDIRHRFIVSIPVADRPAHLHACLESLYQVCRRFGYGGQVAGVYTHIRVVLAEDSRDPDNVRRHVELAEEYRGKGLQVSHFGQDEQYALLRAIPDAVRDRLAHILTTQPADRFYLKGQAANRNLSILKCLELAGDDAHTLYYFVDSDEAFCVNRLTAAGEDAVCAVNYFYYLDRIFRTTDTRVLTGKMVGDPPVSPSVMAANFLGDVTAFFAGLSRLRPDQDCRYHGHAEDCAARLSSGAVYHDMADLFGYAGQDTAVPYRCPLAGAHDHVACLQAFARRLASFFFGEHLTRSTLFAYASGFDATLPARTVYPGNCVADRAGLRYIIPFAHLRLRMSGPTAGRLIAAEIGDRFASANLPHLHRRTNAAGLGEAFRPGVELDDVDQATAIDLSNEFERQFFGDLMLFTAEALVGESDVGRPFDPGVVTRNMERIENELLERYRRKQETIVAAARRLDKLVFDDGHWWLREPGLTDALALIRTFLANVDRNFGAQAPAWRSIRSSTHRDARKRQLVEALVQYRDGRDAWDSLFV